MDRMSVAGQIEELPDFNRSGAWGLRGRRVIWPSKHWQSLIVKTAAGGGPQRLDQTAELVEVLVQRQLAGDRSRVWDRARHRRVTIVVEQPGLVSGEEIILQLRIQL